MVDERPTGIEPGALLVGRGGVSLSAAAGALLPAAINGRASSGGRSLGPHIMRMFRSTPPYGVRNDEHSPRSISSCAALVAVAEGAVSRRDRQLKVEYERDYQWLSGVVDKQYAFATRVCASVS